MRRRHLLVRLALAVMLLASALGFVVPWLLSRSPSDLDLRQALQPPVWAGGEWTRPLGTDQLGRDVLVLLSYGARISLLIGVVAPAVAAVVGTTMGLVAGYYGGIPDVLISRMVDVQLAVPVILLALALLLSVGPSIPLIIAVISMAFWVSYARIVRAEVLALRERDFVALAEVAGLPRWRIVVRHIAPNIMPSVLVLFTLDFGKAILAEASLSFLGLGVQPPSSAWGLMIQNGRGLLTTHPYLVLIPGGALAVLAVAANMLGDAVRDRFDPSLQSAA